MDKKRKILVLAAVALVLTCATLWFLFGGKLLTNRYVSRDVDGEVLDWNPLNGELKVKIPRGSTVITTTVPVNLPGTTSYVMHAGFDGDGLKAVTRAGLSGPDDELWDKAFCVGDIVRLTSDEFDVSKVEIKERLEVTYVQKINEVLCK